MFWRRKRAPTIDAEGLSRALHAHKLAIEQLREDLEALGKRHEQLRGRFYGSGAHKQAEPQPQTKADILRAAGWVPGKPFKHD